MPLHRRNFQIKRAHLSKQQLNIVSTLSSLYFAVIYVYFYRDVRMINNSDNVYTLYFRASDRPQDQICLN